jgi:sodium-dependent phosphate transporter
LAAGLTISLASFFGLPVSTTQIIVGAEVGIGMSESLSHGTNYKLLLKTWLKFVFYQLSEEAAFLFHILLILFKMI